MPMFYFHLRYGSKLAPDDSGQAFSDGSDARHEAEMVARELVADAIKTGQKTIPDAVVVTDQQGGEVATVPLTSVLPSF